MSELCIPCVAEEPEPLVEELPTSLCPCSANSIVVEEKVEEEKTYTETTCFASMFDNMSHQKYCEIPPACK